ncbi:hypothetical protein M422DRAFT_253862 [Sphaerobolus stellatus SS14]|uniref:Uncharacterized protein n=1 Tax=Sphaerobolus stellatus (strain SS14) TaxID=990650 RepID=A0A0C9VWP0_SPHS4|nr:hypothetical protein M422DRAFT_253862 [Sphaerobolus stellatus SS14]
MSVPNAVRDDPDGYSLKEDAFIGFHSNLLTPHPQQAWWITDASTPIRVGSHILKGHKDSSQVTAPVKLPTGADFLTLLLKHCSLSKEQTYNHIILYMKRDEEKLPMSTAAVERAAYMQLHQSVPALNKGKKLLTGNSQSKSSAHAPQPVKIRQSRQQQLDADLEAYNKQCEPVLPYSEEPPIGEPDEEKIAPTIVGASGTLISESTMNVDPEIEDLYK